MLSERIRGEGDILRERAAKAGQRVLQEGLVQEVRDHLGRDHCQRRREAEPHRGYRTDMSRSE